MRSLFTTLLLLTFLFAIGQTKSLEYDWQIRIADKPNKTILDYYLLLPSELLNCESTLNTEYGQTDSYEFRIETTQVENTLCKVDLKNGFLIADPDGYIRLAMFRNLKNGKTIIAFVSNCGEMPVQCCNYGFLTFDNKRKRWENANYVFPFEKMKAKCLKIEKSKTKNWYDDPEVVPYLNLPEFGTTIKIMDAFSNDEHLLFSAKWNGERFEIQ